jgi:predicted O-linked N-acetylglucosamine transferase (SPINDLY family)
MQGKYAQAADALHRATQLDPRHALALRNLGNVLLALGRQREGVEALKAAVAARPDYADAASNLLYAQYNLDDVDPASLYQQHIDWARTYAADVPAATQHDNDRDPERCLRVGFMSPDFKSHPVGRFILPLLQHHDRAKIEAVLYSDAAVEDDATVDLRNSAEEWRPIVGLSNEEVAAQVRRDRIDILIDLAGHTSRPRLLVFARKPAPVQATYLGYPGTTGLPAIDWRITDAVADPPGMTDALHSEQLLRLEGCAWCFQPPSDAPLGARAQRSSKLPPADQGDQR